MKILIRKEVPEDYKEVENLVQTAFLGADYSDENEQDLVALLRKESAFIPELSLVAVKNGIIVGHILFSTITIGDSPTKAVTLAPLAVLPEYQGKGIGSMLILAGHKAARELGFQYSVVVGHPDYYPRFAYKPAKVYHITSPTPVPETVFLVHKLDPSAPDTQGEVKYQKPFTEV